MNGSLYQIVYKQLRGSKERWREIAKETGVPFRTVENIGTGRTRNPGVRTVEKIIGYFNKVPHVGDRA